MLLPHAKSIAHTHTRARGVICAKRKRTKKKKMDRYKSIDLFGFTVEA